MTQAVLTLNAGSSSLKAGVFLKDGNSLLALGLADRIGPSGTLVLKGADGRVVAEAEGIGDHGAAVQAVLAALRRNWPGLSVAAVGHRVVHGGADHAVPVEVTPDVMAGIAALVPFAPLHQPHNIAGIRAAMAAFPGVPQVACFDTAFHRTQGRGEETYALPRGFYDRGIRRYGFHGLSYQFVSEELFRLSPQLAEGRVVIAHLGNGASLCAMRGGRSVATTMGFSTLDGLAMGTRPGRIDAGVILHLIGREGMSAAEVSELLYKRSGLLGLSGLSNDMRALETAGTPEAIEAIDYFVRHCQREIAGMAAAIGGIDALVFCGGIGENARNVRAAICAGMGWMGLSADPDRNAANATVISPEGAKVAVLVIPTNEEAVIARAAWAAAEAV